MKLKLKIFILLSGSLTLLSGPLYPGDISICSFNIQFLGSSKIRDNKALTDMVKDYDIVVIQELVSPPYKGKFPNGNNYKPDEEAAQFFDLMIRNKFEYKLSEEDTGPGKKNHSNANGTEWWVIFYKSNKVKYAGDLPSGFLSKKRTANKEYDRVPYAFPLRTVSNKLDFVLIPVHLHPGGSSKDRIRRFNELHSIHKWIYQNNSAEKDFIILGDMNIEDKNELNNLGLKSYSSLNANCSRTNTLINFNVNNGAKPYDHVMYNIAYTKDEIDMNYGFKVIDLIKAMKPYWAGTESYPGNPYNHNLFRQCYSDHHPVVFKMTELSKDDD